MHGILPDVLLPRAASSAVQALAVPDWLHNTLLISGPTEELARFREAAAGSGHIPWNYDLDQLAEDWFLRMATPEDGVRAISVYGARILARRVRDAAAALYQQRLETMATERSCPLDLHRLVPLPARLLQLGPGHPDSAAWLWSHWSTTAPLRHVEELPLVVDRRRAAPARLRLGFWSADWSPWQAVLRLRRAWPRLRFDLRPDQPAGRASLS